MSQCAGSNSVGDPCGTPASNGRDWCIWHDPDRRGEAIRARSRGGNQTKRSKVRVVMEDELPPLQSQEQCERALQWVFVAVGSGKVDPLTARELTNTIKTLHTTMGNRLALEKRAKELEKRLRALDKVDR
jgi:hypothetical protein